MNLMTRPRARRRSVQGMRWIVIACLLSFATGIAWARLSPEISIHRPLHTVHVRDASLSTWSVCLREAAYYSGVDPALLQAIVIVESGEHPYAFGWNDRTGARRTYKAPSYSEAVARLDALEQQQVRFDVGLAQVNSRNLKILEQRTGIAPVQALDPCTNLRLAGIVLREQIRIHGPTWRAVAGYNGALAYVPKVRRVFCSRVPDAPGCELPHPLSVLLCEPLPIAQTERYYRVFKTN